MKTYKNLVRFVLSLGTIWVLMLLFYIAPAYAATSITINTVDYKEENIIVNNNGNSKIYFATENDAARNTWDIIPADEGSTTTIDFSWVSPINEQVIVIKGEDNVQSRVTLKARAKRLDVSIRYDRMAGLKKSDTIAKLLNIMSSAGTGDNPISFSDLEWKKGVNGSWKDTSTLTITQLEKLQIRGADLYFRIKAVNDETVGTKHPDGTNGRRVSNEVRLKIARKASPVVVGIDGEDFTAQIRYGKEYRVTYDGITTPWVKVTDKSVREVPLAVMLNNSRDGFTPARRFPAMIIEIRDYATANKAASKITEISLKEQRVLSGNIIEGEAPEDANVLDPNIYISHNGSASISITVPSASAENPYQYCIVKPGDVFDLKRVSWSTISRGTAVRILSGRVPEGSSLYIRQKEIKSKAATKTSLAVDFELASTYLEYKVRYPSVPNIESKNFTFIKGITEDISFNIRLNTIGKLPYETKIKSIKYGNREIDFSCIPEEIEATNPNVEYAMKVTLNTNILNNMPNSYSRALTITFENGTVDKTSVKLAIQSPTPASALSTAVTKGKAKGTASIRVLNTVRPGNVLVYTVTDTKIDGLHTESVINDGIKFNQEVDVPVTAGKYVTVYEINETTKKVVRYRCIQITSNHIN